MQIPEPQAAALSEPRRRSYLQALGLDLLRARGPLPGAAESAALIWAEPARVASTATPAALPAAAFSARAALHPESAATSVIKPAIPATLLAASVPARFSLLLVPISTSHCALIDLDNQPALEGTEARLWSAICAAFCWQAQSSDLPAQFNWPIPGLPATLAAGQEALSGWLHTQLEQPLALLVFAEAIAAYTPHATHILPSLQDLLAEPLRKRELMHTLSDLLPS